MFFLFYLEESQNGEVTILTNGSRQIDHDFTIVYAFIYSTECLKYAQWISNKRQIPLVVHIADYSPEFENHSITNILRQAYKLVCITDNMRSTFEKILGRKDIEVLHNGAEEALL